MQPLSLHLREATMREHKSAESSPFIVGLMGGSLTLSDYTRYLVNMAWLYRALENQVVRGVAVAGSEGLWDPRLNRVESITSDLENLGVSDWSHTTKPSGAMRSYIEHLSSLGGKSDPRLIAHHYTRYLGDLSGGQAIAALVARHYDATPDQLSFYRFEGIDNVVRFKEEYRRSLDAVALSEKEHEMVITEAKMAFARNQHVFDDLEHAA